MKAYYVTQDKNVGITKLKWSDATCLSLNKEVCIQSKNEFFPDGLVVLIDMDDNDVVEAVAACLCGNSCTVKCKVLEVVG